MVDHEQQVREAAYFLWQCEGRPEGRAEMHWRMAEIGIAMLSYLSHGRGALPAQCHLSDDSEAA
jgi:Protein of unknown function (DUF2934)